MNEESKQPEPSGEGEPVEMRVDLERLLRKAEIKGDHDPLMPLMLALADYDKTIPKEIAVKKLVERLENELNPPDPRA